MQSRRAQWAEQVRQWRHSGLSAREFARRVGVNASTLTHWAWRLGREPHVEDGARGQHGLPAARASFVEVVAAAIEDSRFELDLGDGRRLRIPAQFEAAGLQRLLAVLDTSGR